jgi:tRNA modification GTPase
LFALRTLRCVFQIDNRQSAIDNGVVNLDDTIVALSTPPGRGGIGVVRLSGPEARTVAEPLLRLKHSLEPNRSIFGELVESDTGEKIDEVVATYFAKPHSYTTDDIVEISAHGSPVVLRHIVEQCLARGARLAEPGEFTMRAFLNGRLDLTQAEAVRDLIDAQTLYQARVAARQLGGSLSHTIAPTKHKLVELIATLEAGIDFAEDDVSVLPWDEIRSRIEAIAAPLRDLSRSFTYGKLVRDGLTLAIVGRPNVGKSSLFNRLVARERAIVTSTPGTTRDLVTETVSLGGIPVHLVDTAGIRQALDEAESIGIRKSMEALADADLILVVLDASQPHTREDDELLNEARDRTAITVLNKIDIGSNDPMTRSPDHPIPTSALTGEGIETLRRAIISLTAGPQQESNLLTNVRQQTAVNSTLASLASAQKATETNTPHEMLLLDLYSALRALDDLTGATTTDDILNLIFSTFCIGK